MSSPHKTASLTVRAITITPPSGAPVLIAELDISCEICGETSGRIMGHHLKTIVRALQMVIEQHPELCGPEGVVTERVTFGGTHTPGSEALN